MTAEQQIEIPLSKSKIALMLIGSLIFVAIGLWFVIAPPAITNTFWGNPTKLAILGYVAIIFFGGCAVFFGSKLPHTKPGLVINNTGIIDNSGALAGGLILWSDIENIALLEIHNQKLIMLEVKQPEVYINRQKNILKRKLMELNHRTYGTPLSITTNALSVPFQELFDMILQKFQETSQQTGHHAALLPEE